MGTSSAGIGYGTTLSRGNGATPEVFTAIGEVKDISGPGLSVDDVEATHQGSPDGFKEFVPGLIDGGEVAFDIQLVDDETTQEQVITDLNARTKRNYKLVSPGGGGWTFAGYVKGFEPSYPVQDVVTASVTIKVSGKPTRN